MQRSKYNQKDDPLYKLTMLGLEVSGLYYSKYRAMVVDNDDPENLNRLQVMIPNITDLQSDETWAFPTNQWGGKDYGINLLPQVGDTVWIEFEFGDPEHPIWSHHGYALDEKPEEFSNPNIYGFKTPLGTKIIINDNENEEEILVKLNSNKDWIKINKYTLELESKLIKLGEQGKEQAVLGETLKSKIESLTDELKNLTDILSSHTHAGPTGPPIKAAEIVKISYNLVDLKNTYKEFLSKKVKID